MAAEIPISLVKSHSLSHATADLFVIPWLSISQLRRLSFSLPNQLRNIVELINFYFSTRLRGKWGTKKQGKKKLSTKIRREKKQRRQTLHTGSSQFMVSFPLCAVKEADKKTVLMNLPYHLVQPKLLHYCNEKHIRICLDTWHTPAREFPALQKIVVQFPSGKRSNGNISGSWKALQNDSLRGGHLQKET